MTTIDKSLALTDYDSLLAKLWDQPENIVDFKEPFLLASTAQKQVYGIIKDILGLSNRKGGGFIIIGKKDATGEAINCNDDIVKSFDNTKVHDQVKAHGKPEPTFSVYSGTSPMGTKAIIIHVKEFTEMPVICCKNLSINGEKGLILRAGATYIRSKTGNAQTCEISTEQDMRDLIERAVLKNSEKLTSAFSTLISRYVQGDAIDLIAKRESIQNWKNEQNLLDTFLRALPELSDPLIQLIIHPMNYEKDLFDISTFQNQLSRSSFFHCGRWFPCPDFEIRGGAFDLSSNCLVHTSSKRYRDCVLQSTFGITTAGFMIYRDEFASVFDSSWHGKPFFILQAFLTVYRAMGFLGRLFNFMPKTSGLKIELLVTNTYQRIPCTHVDPTLDKPVSFFRATEISAPKISFDIELVCQEISNNPVDTTLKIAKKLLNLQMPKYLMSSSTKRLKKFPIPSNSFLEGCC